MPTWWSWLFAAVVVVIAYMGISIGKPGAAAALVLLAVAMFVVPKLFASED